ncbi:hypothetical protein Patl1_36564 [Pistacia atlantica]|nr:hypothetical protein Patl1_36564 [Pistacia atlantica]
MLQPQIESGDKIIMPPSALDRLASLHIDYPMLFELRNNNAERVSHCGVLEFIAEEGMIYMPYWMMENLLLQEGDIVRVKNVTLPKGKYVKLQPHTKDFLDISNPKAILETTLRNYSCLTTGDSIMVAYNNKKYYIDIIETKPSNAITIIETDCEVDFAPPLDYKEPERPIASASGKATSQVIKPSLFFLQLRRLLWRLNQNSALLLDLGGVWMGNLWHMSLHQFLPQVFKDKQPAVANSSGKPSAGSSSQSAASQTSRKTCVWIKCKSGSQGNTKGILCFSNLYYFSISLEAGKEKKPEEPKKKEEPKFQPFTGKKYSLKG